LIDFDFTQNNFSYRDSRDIQDFLKRNKELYDAERLKEWRERKHMRNEDEKLKELNLQEQSGLQNERMEEEAREIREAELSDKWKKFMLEQEIDKQQIIQQLTEAALLRGTKGKKKKKGKGKGK
tara:strand:- start:81 stop:452 length:372 start_codon:yes stop_codon:yes gene_type:complete